MISRVKPVVAIFLYPLLLLAQAPANSPASAQTPPPAPATAKAYPVMSAAAKQRLHQIYGMVAHSKASLIYASFGPDMKKNSSEAKVANVTKQLGNLGTETKLVSEVFQPGLLRAETVYTRVANYSKAKLPVVTTISIDEDGQVAAMRFGEVPNVPSDEYSNYKTKTKLHLPFSGDWLVYQGGRSLIENSFVASEDSRYTTAFVLLKDGRPFAGEGKSNQDYYCYGQSVLSPADGTVVRVQDGYPDATPGKPVLEIGKGNLIVISHGDSEFSVLSSLKSGSIKRERGDKVKAGDIVGQCGNSGTAAVPHVEYRLQNSKGMPLPSTLPAQFVDYLADGKPVALGEPSRGQMVANAANQP